jgi:hypothetical protein
LNKEKSSFCQPKTRQEPSTGTVDEIPHEIVNEVPLTDYASRDNTTAGEGQHDEQSHAK